MLTRRSLSEAKRLKVWSLGETQSAQWKVVSHGRLPFVKQDVFCEGEPDLSVPRRVSLRRSPPTIQPSPMIAAWLNYINRVADA